jgi:hypothetical protein
MVVEAFTRDARTASILATALEKKWKVGYLTIDPTTNEISRVKLNRDDQ